MSTSGSLAAVLLAVTAAGAAAQDHRGRAQVTEHDRAMLVEGLGSWSQNITASVPEAQRLFDQGLRLTYSFHHEEAARSFETAMRLDPSCAMCAWGLAYALSPNTDLPTSPEAEARALTAIRRAQSLAAKVTEREQAYIEAMAKRFGEPVGEERAQRDSAYAAAMRAVALRYPEDADAQVLYADALLNLRIRFRSATLRTGARLHWAESGNSSGRAVILLHGYSDSWFSWSRVMPLLPDDVRAIAVDLRGHGRSADTPRSFRIDELAEDVAALMDHLGLPRATVVGHSLGTLVAQGFAADHPSRLDGLVLIGAVPSGSLPIMRELRAAVAAEPDPVTAEFIREFQYSTLATPLPEPFMARVIAESSRLSADVWRGVADGWVDADFRSRLTGSRPTTLLLWGDRDAMFSRDDQNSILAAIPGSRMITYEGIGHALHWEAPERAARDIVQFLESLPRTSAR